jgi:hypothetical protein
MSARPAVFPIKAHPPAESAIHGKQEEGCIVSRNGKNLTTVLLWVVGLAAAAVAAWQFYLFVVFRNAQGALDAQGGGYNLWFAVGAAVVACACVCLGIFGRINQTEEFHITS